MGIENKNRIRASELELCLVDLVGKNPFSSKSEPYSGYVDDDDDELSIYGMRTAILPVIDFQFLYTYLKNLKIENLMCYHDLKNSN